MTTVTSLPELVTGVSSIRVAGSRDLALGDALGSCLFNPLLVSVVDAFYRPSACSRAPPRVMRCPPDTAAVLLAIVGVNLLVPASIPGLTLSPATLPIYALALRNVLPTSGCWSRSSRPSYGIPRQRSAARSRAT